jgi:hypothetical protein
VCRWSHSISSGEEDDVSAEESCGGEDVDDDITLGLNDGILTMSSKKKKHTVRLEAAGATKLAREQSAEIERWADRYLA